MKTFKKFIQFIKELFLLKPEPVWCKYRGVSVDPSETCNKLEDSPAWTRYPTPYHFECQSCGLKNDTSIIQEAEKYQSNLK